MQVIKMSRRSWRSVKKSLKWRLIFGFGIICLMVEVAFFLGYISYIMSILLSAIIIGTASAFYVAIEEITPYLSFSSHEDARADSNSGRAKADITDS